MTAYKGVEENGRRREDGKWGRLEEGG